MALQIRGVHQVVLTVSNPKSSAVFYEKVLGARADFVTENVHVAVLSEDIAESVLNREASIFHRTFLKRQAQRVLSQ